MEETSGLKETPKLNYPAIRTGGVLTEGADGLITMRRRSGKFFPVPLSQCSLRIHDCLSRTIKRAAVGVLMSICADDARKHFTLQVVVMHGL